MATLQQAKLLEKSLSASERARASRALARIEACHRDELSKARSASTEAKKLIQRYSYQAALDQHVAAAGEAKRSCELERVKAELRVTQLLLTQRTDEKNASITASLAAAAETAATRSILCNELWLVDELRANATRLIERLTAEARLKEDELASLRQQCARSEATLIEQQQHITQLRKQLGREQQRNRRQVEAQHTLEASQRSDGAERSRLADACAAMRERLERAEQAARFAAAREEAMLYEAATERDAVMHTLHRCRKQHAAEMAEAAANSALLADLVERLCADTSVVSLRNGGGCTLSEYVQQLRMRLQRRYAQQRPNSQADSARHDHRSQISAPEA